MKVLPAALRCLAAVAIMLLAQTESTAQGPPNLSSSETERLETALQRNPNDAAARSRLLDHYYLDKSVAPKDAIAARRRHILWLIENAPEGELAGSPQATIDASGYSLADPQGYKLAAEAWRAQAEKTDAKAAVLVNAAYFFKTDDREYTVSLLRRALTLNPQSKEIGARLGDEYALIILGITLENRNHYPLRADRTLAQSGLAQSAREALENSRNPYVLAKAGYMLAWQGAILYASGQMPFDPLPLATGAAERAVGFAPGQQDVAAFRQQVRELERMAGRTGRTKKAPVSNRAQAQPRLSEPAGHGATQSLSASLRPAGGREQQVDLKRITMGMSRNEVLKLGTPAGRITMDDDGQLIEIFQYRGDTATQAGTIRLKDGIVSSIDLQ
jgi:hypothetical protein